MSDATRPDTSGNRSIEASVEPALKMDLKTCIRPIADWPMPGVQFQHITPLLHNPQAFRRGVDALVRRYNGVDGDPALRPVVIAGLDARGFILGAVVAYALGVGFVPIRKHGKLPFTPVQETYALEYGSASVELHPDAVRPGDRALLRDDLIATGGAMLAGKKLLEQLGATVLEGAAPLNLTSLVGPTSSRRRACPCSRWLNSPGRDAGREGVPACARLPELL